MKIIRDEVAEMSDADRVRGEPAYMTEDTIEISKSELNDIHDSYIEYICEFGRLHRPVSWTSILDVLQLNEKRHFEIFMSFSDYLSVLIELKRLAK